MFHPVSDYLPRIVLGAVLAVPVGIGLAQPSTSGASTGQPLSLLAVIERLEQQGYGPFSELSFDDGAWEVEVRQNEVSYELTVDPATGKVLSQHRDDPEQLPPAGSLLLSELLRKLAQTPGLSDIEEISFERRYWEIEAYFEGRKHEYHVDPITGQVISDRLDD